MIAHRAANEVHLGLTEHIGDRLDPLRRAFEIVVDLSVVDVIAQSVAPAIRNGEAPVEAISPGAGPTWFAGRSKLVDLKLVTRQQLGSGAMLAVR